MTRQAEAAESTAELFADEQQAAQATEIESLIALAGGAREAVGVLLVQLAEIERARVAALSATSLGYRRGLQPPRPDQ